MKVSLERLWARNLRILVQAAVNDADQCVEYSRMTTPMPAISVYRHNDFLLRSNGRHRVVAATLRGETEIETVLFPRD